MSRNPHIVGSKRLNLRQTTSTNSEMMSRGLEVDDPEGFVIRTQFQTAGRGQFENKWMSNEAENVLISVLLKPHFVQANQLFRLNIAVALAIFDLVDGYFQGKCKIKWSNDILLNGKKVCGILIENTLSGNQLGRSIVGIGLNVNQLFFNEIQQHATSFYKEMGESFETDIIYEELLTKLDFRYSELRSGWHQKQRNEYLKNLYGLNELKTYVIAGEQQHATLVGIDNDGRMLLRVNGVLKAFQNGEAKLIYG